MPITSSAFTTPVSIPGSFVRANMNVQSIVRRLRVLGGEHFRSGFEVGCSIGELTCMLAGYCDALLAVDIVEAPLRAAHSVCAEQPWVRFAQMEVPRQWPDDVFDLIVLSEVLYFLSPEDIIRVADRAADTLRAPRQSTVGKLARPVRPIPARVTRPQQYSLSEYGTGCRHGCSILRGARIASTCSAAGSGGQKGNEQPQAVISPRS